MRHPDWINVTPSNPCPVCSRPTPEHTSRWCRVHRNKEIAICPFVESKKFIEDAGWVHRLTGDTNESRNTIPYPIRQPLPRIVHWDRIVASYCEAVQPDRLATLASNLGVSDLALDRLSIGSKEAGEWTFPMYDNNRRVIGIRIRAEDGSKYAVTGSRNGLFIPRGISKGDPLIICEGPTDTAAMLDLGYDVIGRASCLSGNELIPPLCKDRQVVILADSDDAGRLGAKKLAESIIAVTKSLRVITAGYCKDAREWLRSGATRREVDSVIKATKLWKI